MPVSTGIHLSHCLNLIAHLNPRSVLDVGCGFGTWGFLCRMHLDIHPGRVQMEKWQARIDGIELFEPYIQAHQRALYTSIRIADIRDVAPTLDRYDLVIAGDVIEHLNKDEGIAVLHHLYNAAQGALLVNIPIGEGWDHPEQYGNPGELHRSQWMPEDFDPWPNHQTLMDLPCGKYGVFYCPKNLPERVGGLWSAAERYQARNDLEAAHIMLTRILDLDPAQIEALPAVLNFLIEKKQLRQAIHTLERSLQAAPHYHYGYIVLSQLYAVAGMKHEARSALVALLEHDGLAEDTADEARSALEKLSCP
ncbi:MAG: hypothetical protein AMXMBFR84_11670 [Candidatus Hydrogenedentota bacterium]